MRTSEVIKLSDRERFFYWIFERHQIYLKRRAGKPKPWTDDEVLQSYFFTNPYRENDKVTKWFRENIRDLICNDIRVVMATIIFRWFNWPPTGNILAELPWTEHEGNLLIYWHEKEALARLREARDRRGEQIFTGAFMINSPAGKPKLEAICERIDKVWQDRENLNTFFLRGRSGLSMREAHKFLTQYDGLGGFMAYEVVCDLRYTSVLERAPDKDTWCNPGPGAIRGLCRVLGIPFEKGNNSTSPPVPPNWEQETIRLLADLRARFPKMPRFEMREVEHSLCEFDKYSRLLYNDGRSKRRFDGK